MCGRGPVLRRRLIAAAGGGPWANGGACGGMDAAARARAWMPVARRKEGRPGRPRRGPWSPRVLLLLLEARSACKYEASRG